MTESADLNKSEITLAVTEAAAQWLEGIGAKAIETEVLVAPGWVADLAAFWVPTRTEAIKAKIMPRKNPYQLGMSTEQKDVQQQEHLAWESKFALIPDFVTIAHEVKTTRSDFCRDKKWRKKPVADIQILSYVRGIIDESEIPPGWWAIEHSTSGAIIEVKKRSVLRNVSVDERLSFIAWLADRMHNRHANKFFKSLNKRHRENEREDLLLRRLSNCIRVILDVSRGDRTANEALKRFYPHDKIPGNLREDLKEIEGILKPVKTPVGELDK